MLESLTAAYLESVNSTLPDTIEGAAAVALKRDGALAMIEEVFEFEPQSVREEREGEDNE